jgi:hypothetical protein
MHRINNPFNNPASVRHDIGPAERVNDDRGLTVGRSMRIERFQRGGRFMNAPSHEENESGTWIDPVEMRVRSGNQCAAEVGITEQGVEIDVPTYASEAEMDQAPESGTDDAVGAGMSGGDGVPGPSTLQMTTVLGVLAVAGVAYLFFSNKD